MYIEYITPQRVAGPNYTEYDSKGGDYRPTWLIRTADWEKVPGHEATDGYHTLSYCWEQSGEKVLKFDGEYDLKDDGHHRIKTVVETQSASNLSREHETTEVKYEGVLQQVCKDFDIEYLWYDKICIDQSNKEEKQREIKQMHLIYSNARYTVALIPEVNIKDTPRDFDRIDRVTGNTNAKYKALYQVSMSLWWKRSWTLAELMMSTRMLIVGRNAHFWSLANFKQGDEIKENDFLSEKMLGFNEREFRNANVVLNDAHSRTSTNDHDKIFALANIFHDIIDIDINYSIDVSTLMKTFYRQLAQKDLSILCFGSNLLPDGDSAGATTMDSHDLPSWTGVAGNHSSHAIAGITLDRSCDYSIDDSMQLRIACRFYTIRPTKSNDNGAFHNNEQATKAMVNSCKVITSMDDFDGNESEALDWSQWRMVRATACFDTHYHKPDDSAPFLSPVLPLSLTEECDECVILGVVFDSVVGIPKPYDLRAGYYEHDYLSPVAKKSADGSSYKIIGVILLKHFQYDEPRPTPQEYMDRMFGNLGCETQEFCIV